MFKTNRSNRASRNRISKTIGWVPVVNGLEERVLLAKYIVTNVSMTGAGSLMEAVGLANTSPGDDTITFDETVFKSDQTIYDDYGYSSSGLWIEDKSGGKLEIQGPTFSALTMNFNTCGEFYIKTPCIISDLRLYVRPSTDVNNNYFYRNLVNYGKNYLFAAVNNSSTLELNNISISTVTGTFNYFATGVMNTSTGKLTINNSSIKGFYSVDYYSTTSNPIGSGVWNEGIASLNNVTIMNCSGLSGLGSSGGGIINSNVMTISNSIVSYSSAGLINHGNLSVSFTKITENENGIWNNNVASILNSEVSGNKKHGGIFNNTNGLMTISQSSVTNNIGSSEGVGIKNRSSIGVSIINSTISNNTNSSLSAVLNDTNAKMSISSSTISGNSAGIKALSSVLISDSLVSNTGYDVSGSVDSVSGYNLVANGTGLSGITNGTNGNRIGTSGSKVDAKLQPLNYYGGSTKSFALQALSPAIDAGGTQVSLTSAISNSVTSFAMTNASLLGCTSGLMIPVQVDNEIMMVIAVSLTNNTVTVIRGSAGTQATTHLSGAKVYLLDDQRGISMLNTPDIGAFESQKYILSIASGNNQSQTVNKSLTSAFKVKVTDPKGIAVSGVQVSFNAPAFGAGCSFPTSNLAVSDSTGVATSQVAIANTKAGSYSLTASIPDIGFVTFYESSVADSFAMVQPYIGDNNRYTVNQTYYYDLIAARSTDQFGNPVPNIPIRFNNPNTSGANCTFANTSSVISDSYGVAYSPNITTNTVAGTYKVTATGISAIPASFTLNNIADIPSNIILVSGGDQITPIGTTFSKPVIIGMTDKYNNRSNMSGLKIIFDAPANCTFSPGFAFTNSNGTATFQPIVANMETGFYRVYIYADPNSYLRPWGISIKLGNSRGVPITVTNTNDSGAGSLRDAISIANAEPGEDQIVFTGSAFSSNATITLGSTLVLEGDTKIYGPSATRLTISGDKKCTVLVNRGVSEISNLTITSGNSSNSSYFSGGIDNTLNLVLDNMTFINCNGYTGAIYSGTYDTRVTNPTLGASKLVILNSRFSDNTASVGGAILNHGFYSQSVLEIYNSTFDRNKSNQGGTIQNTALAWSPSFYNSKAVADLLISNCTIDNSSATYGGVLNVYAYNGSSNVIISNSSVSNTSSNNGGSVYVDSSGYSAPYYSNITITDSRFANATATNLGGHNYNNIYGNTTGYSFISNSTFSNGNANSGGAIYLASTNMHLLNINNSSFINNSANSNGGAITNLNNSTVNISKSTFAYNNSANGGAFYNDAANSSYNPVINLNSATVAFNSASHGGGLMSMAGNINVFNSIIANNTSSDGPDIKGNIATANYSLIGDSSQSNILKGSQNIFGDPKLGNLGFYGGPTQTIPILKGSLAINNGTTTVIGTTDQRGLPYSTADIGAYASQKTSTISTISASSTTVIYGTTVTLTSSVAPGSGMTVPTGNVEFYDGTILIATSALNSSGVAVYSTARTSAGNHSFSSRYLGDATFANSNSTSNVNLTVNQAPLSVTINDKTKLYAANLPVLTYSFTGLVAGDTSSVFSGSLTTSANATSAVGSYPITAGTLSAGSNYKIAFANGTLSITPALLSVSASPASKVYGASIPGLNYTYSGLVNGDNATVFSGSLTTTATSSSAVGNYPITQGSLKAGNNYTIAFTNGTLTITPTTLQVTGSNTTKAYGANLPVLGYTYSGLVNGDSSNLFSGSLATTATANSSVGNYPITQGTLSAGNNYSIVYSNGTLKIAPVSLVVVASNISKVFGANVPELTYSYSGLVNSDTSAIFTGNLSTTATSNSPVADYPIVQGNLTAGSNYNISFTNGTLSVLKSGSVASISVPASSIAGSSISITSSVRASSPGAGTPTGSVQFYDGSSLIGTVILDTNAQATLNTSGLVIGNHLIKSVYIGDTSFNTSTSSVATLEILTNKTIVQSFIQDASSVTVVFNNPIATTLLQINDAYSGSTLTEEADLIIKDASNLAVKGSLIVAPDAKSATFIKTGAGFANGTYSVRLRSAVNAFRNSTGELLDGDNDGQAGGDYQTSFTVANLSRVVSIPDVVRGPGQALRVNPADPGIPIKINDAQDVYSFNVRLKYDPTLMIVTDIAVPSNLSSVLQVTYNITSAGQIDVTGVATNGLTSGTQSLFMINGKVPDKAPYRSKAELFLSNIHLYKSDKSEITTTIDQGIQLVSFIGDVTGDGRYNALDTLRIQRYLVNLDRWHAQYPLVDPVMVADITGDGRVNALDSLYLQRYLVNMPVIFLSAPPVTSVTQTMGLDPVIRLPKNLTAYRGQNIQVPVELQNTDPQSIQVNSFEVAISIDPKTFRFLNIRSGATLRTRYDAHKGILVIGGILPDVTLKPGESLIIAIMNLKVTGHAVATVYALNLLDQARIGKEQYATSVNGGTLVLIPAPTSGANDSVDGVVKVVERQKTIVAGVRHRKHRFLRI